MTNITTAVCTAPATSIYKKSSAEPSFAFAWGHLGAGGTDLVTMWQSFIQPPYHINQYHTQIAVQSTSRKPGHSLRRIWRPRCMWERSAATHLKSCINYKSRRLKKTTQNVKMKWKKLKIWLNVANDNKYLITISFDSFLGIHCDWCGSFWCSAEIPMGSMVLTATVE